jgi:hypothetical protein
MALSDVLGVLVLLLYPFPTFIAGEPIGARFSMIRRVELTHSGRSKISVLEAS